MVEGNIPFSKSERRKKIREAVKILKYDGPVVIKLPKKEFSNTSEELMIN